MVKWNGKGRGVEGEKEEKGREWEEDEESNIFDEK